MRKYDLIVIGGGSAGLNIVRPAASAGWKCALVEADRIGGTCINVGCIPSKTLIHSARVMEQVKTAGKYGVIADLPKANWPAMVKRKDKLVGRINARSRRGIEEDKNIDLYENEAFFNDTHIVEVNNESMTAEKIILAAGARTFIPPVKGLDKVKYLTSTSLMDMKSLPDSMMILGGGVIALEFSQMLARLGVKVTIFQRDDRLVPILEPEISGEIANIIREEGVQIITGAEVSSVFEEDGMVVATLGEDKSRQYRAEKLLIAAGRKSNADRLRLEKTDVVLDDRGYVEVDARFKTSASNVWAVGDLTGGAMFTHRAWHDGMLLSKHLLRGETIDNRSRLIPFAIFTDPEIGSIGLKEAEAEEKGHKVKVGLFNIGHQGRALAIGQTRGFVKLVADAESDKLLGAHILGSEAGELIHELIAAIRFGARVDDLKNMMHVHPTRSEAISSAAWS